MPFEQHQEKNYAKDAQSIFQAALKATEKLEGKVISSAPEKYRFTARFPKRSWAKLLASAPSFHARSASAGMLERPS